MDDRKIKILYVITKSNWGGAQRYVYDLARGLPLDKFEIAIAAGGSGLLTEKLRETDIRAISIPFLQRNVNIIKEFLSLFALIKIFNHERPDIIHLNSTKIGGLGAIAARFSSFAMRYGSLVIFTAHGWGFNEDRPLVFRIIIFLAQWITVLFSDIVICVSRDVFRHGMYFPFSQNKVRMIDLAIAKPLYFTKNEARNKLQTLLNKTNFADSEFPRLPDGQALIGCVAELTKNKGLTYVIEAVGQLPASGFQLLIIGEGEERKKLETLIVKYGLQNTVFLLGFVPEAARYLKAFDIFILPSITEAGAYVLHEAAYAELPAVATKVGGIPGVIKDGENGFLVPSKNPEALAGALKKLLDDEGLRKHMGQKNHEIVSQKFSLPRMLKETIDIYNGR